MRQSWLHLTAVCEQMLTEKVTMMMVLCQESYVQSLNHYGVDTFNDLFIILLLVTTWRCKSMEKLLYVTAII